MEYVAGIFDFIKKRLVKDTSPKPPGWDYETFREYTLAISRSRDYLLPIEEYPHSFDLSFLWHKTLNQMRHKSFESWALIGYQDGQRNLIIPTVAEKGLTGSVPYETMISGLNKANLKAGITDYVGDIHSHPRELFQQESPAFSLGDLYGLLSSAKRQRPSDPKRSFIMVAEGTENIAAFITRGTLERVLNSFSGSYEEFATQWYKKFKWTFNETTPDRGESAEPLETSSPEVWAINKAVAHHYLLVLYRGVKDKPLLRDYPARI